MKSVATLALIVWTLSGDLGCTARDNMIGTVGRGSGASSGSGAEGGIRSTAGDVAGGGGTNNGATSGGSTGAVGGAAAAGPTNQGGAPSLGMTTGGTSGTSAGATGGTGGTILGTGGTMSVPSGGTSGNAAGIGGALGAGGSSVAGRPGMSTGGVGGSTPLGSGGSTPGAGGTTPGAGGSPLGSSGGSSPGVGGSSGAAGASGFACPVVPATCNLIHTWTFSPTSQWQGTYTFSDLLGLTADKTTDPTVLHVTGLGDGAAGFGIYAARCTSLRGFTGVTFTLKGTVISTSTPNTLTFIVQTNEDEPIDTTDMRGQCAGSAGVNCVSPRGVITTSDQPQTVMFSALTGGKPVATLDLDAIIGLQWLVDGESSSLDLSLSDVTLIGPGPMGDCSVSGGSGGAGASSGG